MSIPTKLGMSFANVFLCVIIQTRCVVLCVQRGLLGVSVQAMRERMLAQSGALVVVLKHIRVLVRTK